MEWGFEGRKKAVDKVVGKAAGQNRMGRLMIDFATDRSTKVENYRTIVAGVENGLLEKADLLCSEPEKFVVNKSPKKMTELERQNRRSMAW